MGHDPRRSKNIPRRSQAALCMSPRLGLEHTPSSELNTIKRVEGIFRPVRSASGVRGVAFTGAQGLLRGQTDTWIEFGFSVNGEGGDPYVSH